MSPGRVGEPRAPPFTSLGLAAPWLASARGRGVSVAVIDSGVNPANPHIGVVESGFAVSAAGEPGRDVTDRLGHGTAVTAAIQEKIPEACIVPVKVFDDRLSTTAAALARAVERAVESGVRLINLSLGTPRTGNLETLLDAVESASHRGALIVSPREHRGRRWWPGSFPGCAGVLLDEGCPRDELRLMDDPEGRPVFRASGLPRPIPGVPTHRNLRGISFAAANVTGILGRVLEARPGAHAVEELADQIRRAASKVEERPETRGKDAHGDGPGGKGRGGDRREPGDRRGDRTGLRP